MAKLIEVPICFPVDLYQVEAGHLRLYTGDPETGYLIGQLRRDSKNSRRQTALTKRPGPLSFVIAEWGEFQLVAAATADAALIPETGKPYRRYASERGLDGRECDSSGPRNDLRRISEGAEAAEQITQFTRARLELNLIRNRDASLRHTASGLGRCGLFRDATRGRHLSRPEGAVLGRRSFL